MAIMRNSFIFYRSFYEAISNLDDETRLACYDAILSFGMNGEEIDLEGIAKSIFTLIKPQLEANNRRYENGCKGAEYGSLGGRPKKNFEEDSEQITEGDILGNPLGDNTENPLGDNLENPKKTPKKPLMKMINENENVKDINIGKAEKEGAEKPRTYEPPALEEVNAYCQERKNNVDPKIFIDYYAQRNWMLGKSRITDWKLKVREWEHNDITRASPKKRVNNFVNFPQNNMTSDEFKELETKLLDN